MTASDAISRCEGLALGPASVSNPYASCSWGPLGDVHVLMIRIFALGPSGSVTLTETLVRFATCLASRMLKALVRFFLVTPEYAIHQCQVST